MAEETVTLEALEREAEEALKAEEAPASAETEEPVKATGEEDAEAVEEESASTEQAAHSGKKMVEVPVAKLAKLREQRRTEREEKERLTKQNEELVRQLSLLGNAGQAKQVGAMPTFESCDFDESTFQAKMAEWNQQSLEQKMQEIEQRRITQQRQTILQNQLEADVQQHYQRVEGLGIDADDFIAAERAVRDTFGDLAVDQMISAIGDGSERVVCHLGLSLEEREKVARMIEQDPSGFKAIGYLGRLADKLATAPAQKKISQAPAADRPLTGSNVSGAGSAVLKQLAKLDKLPDRTRLREYKRKLIAAGQTELLRKNGYI